MGVTTLKIKTKNKPNTMLSVILWGIVSLALYVFLFSNSEIVMDYFTRGGIFAIAVITTALIFSFVHGSFANYLVEIMGFKPVSKK